MLQTSLPSAKNATGSCCGAPIVSIWTGRLSRTWRKQTWSAIWNCCARPASCSTRKSPSPTVAARVRDDKPEAGAVARANEQLPELKEFLVGADIVGIPGQETAFVAEAPGLSSHQFCLYRNSRAVRAGAALHLLHRRPGPGVAGGNAPPVRARGGRPAEHFGARGLALDISCTRCTSLDRTTRWASCCVTAC